MRPHSVTQIGKSGEPAAFVEEIVESIRVLQFGPYGWIVQPAARVPRSGTALNMLTTHAVWLTALSPIASRPTFGFAALTATCASLKRSA